MEEKTGTLYYVLPEGELHEEACTWEEIETSCKSGLLSPESLIFLPEKNAWERAIDTNLRSIFRSRPDVQNHPSRDTGENSIDREKLQAQYEEACQVIRRTPEMPQVFLNAASVALDLGDRKAAIRHYQQAIELRPFNTNITSEIKRKLSPGECKNLHFLERHAPFWEELHLLVSYPLTRGFVPFLVPAIALSILALFPFLRVLTVVLCYLWGYQAVTDSASGSEELPDIRKLFTEPVTRLLKPALVGFLAAVEIYFPFFIVAEISILTTESLHNNVFQFIQHSAVMVVLMWVLGIFYLSVALAMSVSPGVRLKFVLNIRRIVLTIVSMEQEYLSTTLFLLVPALFWGILRFVLWPVPVVGIVIPVVLGVYGMLTAGFVLGRLSARYRHLWREESAGGEV